jgi:hypothetical protein
LFILVETNYYIPFVETKGVAVSGELLGKVVVNIRSVEGDVFTVDVFSVVGAIKVVDAGVDETFVVRRLS